ncbi:hypothetical protein ACWEO2_36335 [Nocardia sp. NPDC004278]
MRAWQFTDAGKPLELVELPDPKPDPGELVLDVAAAGLCHLDVDVLEGGALFGRLIGRLQRGELTSTRLVAVHQGVGA